MLQNKYSNTSNGFAHATNCETVISAISYSYNRWQNELSHFALKGLFDIFIFVSPQSCSLISAMLQAPVVQKVDSAIHGINYYAVDNAIGFLTTYLLNSDLSRG